MPLSIKQVAGRAEIMDGTVWRPLSGTPPITSLRTGAGRVTLASQDGQIVMGSASRLRQYQNEADFQEGQFLAQGPIGVFALGSHMVMEKAGRFRVDLLPSGQRLAVISGSLRLSNGNKAYTINAGEQFLVKKAEVSPFRETDPWYDAQFIGVGDATIEALRGEVQLKSSGQVAQQAQIGDAFGPGGVLNTAKNAWAEVGFTGGGYLRLGELSELSVLAVEKTSRGREVTLQLTKGSAWNVVNKGQGGYKINTPIISTAVRGTTFRVDAGGLVKVFEGQVAIPNEGDMTVASGQQKTAGQVVQPLTPDDFDRLNMALDAERAKPMTLQVDQRAHSTNNLAFQVQTLANTTLSATAQTGPGQPTPLPVTTISDGQFQVKGQALPEGVYIVTVLAKRYQASLQWQSVIRIDRTPPTLADLKISTLGRILTITGQAADNADQPLGLTVTYGQSKLTQQVSGSFRILLPATAAGTPTQLKLQDRAGNITHVSLP